MKSTNKYLDITNRKTDYEWIHKETFRTELGFRAISIMYDDHSNDKNSYENILKLKDNIQYRLFAATHQYLVFLKELSSAESYLQKLYQDDPNKLTGFIYKNPYFDKIEQELSSIFDNIIFHVSSIFDYISHIICYIIFKNKSNTVYWSKLTRAARGQNNDFCNEEMKKIIDTVDRRFVNKLYDYRSRLLHNIRNKHDFGGYRIFSNSQFILQLQPSEICLKYFKLIAEDISADSKFTLTYLSSWIIKRTFIEIEAILDVLAKEIKKNSYFGNNLYNPKRGMQSLLIVSINPETNTAEPVSEKLWKEYKTSASR